MAALLGAERPAALKPKLKPPSELELALKRKDPSKWGEISENRAEREIVARGAGGGGLRVPSRPVDLEHYALKQQLEQSASFAHSEARVGAELAREPLTPAQMVEARGVFEVDGNSNSWEGTFWKLYSNSVMLKVDGEWEQW